MDISVLGIDLGKNVCSVVGLDASGAVVMRRRMRRETLIGLAEKLPACIVGMEACCGLIISAAGIVNANEYSRFSALNPAERGGNSRAKTVGLQPAVVREQAV